MKGNEANGSNTACKGTKTWRALACSFSAQPCRLATRLTWFALTCSLMAVHRACISAAREHNRKYRLALDPESYSSQYNDSTQTATQIGLESHLETECYPMSCSQKADRGLSEKEKAHTAFLAAHDLLDGLANDLVFAPAHHDLPHVINVQVSLQRTGRA